MCEGYLAAQSLGDGQLFMQARLAACGVEFVSKLPAELGAGARWSERAMAPRGQSEDGWGEAAANQLWKTGAPRHSHTGLAFCRGMERWPNAQASVCDEF